MARAFEAKTILKLGLRIPGELDIWLVYYCYYVCVYCYCFELEMLTMEPISPEEEPSLHRRKAKCHLINARTCPRILL